MRDYLERLKEAGLASLPGTAAEILDDEVRADLCPDKINTAEWLEVMETAHGVGLRTTATIMFGHVDGYRNWARHLLRIRGLAGRTPAGSPSSCRSPSFTWKLRSISRGGRGRGRRFREAVLMHSVARLVLHPHITNIQTSWVKMGPAVAAYAWSRCQRSGWHAHERDDHASGRRQHGQEMMPAAMEAIITENGRRPRLRTTLYGDAPLDRRTAAFADRGLDPVTETAFA